VQNVKCRVASKELFRNNRTAPPVLAGKPQDMQVVAYRLLAEQRNYGVTTPHPSYAGRPGKLDCNRVRLKEMSTGPGGP